MTSEPVRVVCCDMQPIDPPLGGGRVRLLGLYHNLGEAISTQYVGSYDWPGPSFRRHSLSDSLEEIDVPLSDKHFDVHDRWNKVLGTTTLMDVLFPLLVNLSPTFTSVARRTIETADVVVFCHPWCFPPLRTAVDLSRQLLVYDSQNVEALLKSEILPDSPVGRAVSSFVAITECELARKADLVLACSSQDSDFFQRIYRVAPEKVAVVPNGTFVKQFTGSSGGDAVKQQGEPWPDPTVVFMGSGYGPNLEAARYICSDIAPMLPSVTFAVCGSVANLIAPHHLPSNVKLAGVLSETGKRQILGTASAAINPMFSGSGTNIKMFDFMAASLPVISTPIGARGIERSDEALIVCQPSEICVHLERILGDEDAGRNLGLKARELVEDLYSWEKISPNLGSRLRNAFLAKRSAGNGHRLPDPTGTGSTTESAGLESATADPIRPAERELPAGLAILTTWEVRCGIAEYSRRLTDELRSLGINCAVMANGVARRQDSPGGLRVEWCWDYQALNADKILSFLDCGGIKNVSIQYHITFFAESALKELVRKLTERGIRVNVTLHNFLDPAQSTLASLKEAGAGLVVHSQEGVEHLKRNGIHAPFRLDMSVPESSFEPTSTVRERLGRREPLLIGTCGFLRPHKGMLELIDAMVWLRDLVGEVGLIGMTPLHPAQDSQEYLVKCLERIRRRALEDVVSLNTNFVPEDEIIQNLHACDVLVLPYHNSSEGSSAAARTALAALRPLITSRSRIFDDLAPVVHRMESLHPASIALAVASALTNPLLAGSLDSKARSYSSWHSPATTARRFAQIFQEPAAS